MFHNAQAQRIREETMQIIQHWDTDPHFKQRLSANDPALATALSERKDGTQEIEKIIRERMQEMMAKKRGE